LELNPVGTLLPYRDRLLSEKAAIPLTFRRIRLLSLEESPNAASPLDSHLVGNHSAYVLSILLVYIRTSVDFGEAYVQFPPDENGETGSHSSPNRLLAALFVPADNFTVLGSAIF